jgi:hypothetical protein
MTIDKSTISTTVFIPHRCEEHSEGDTTEDRVNRKNCDKCGFRTKKEVKRK